MDSWGRVQEMRNADGGKEGYAYNFAGSITSTRDANGGVITYRYNSQGEVCEIIDQEGNSETFRYDREGRMTLRTDRNGNRVRTSYNVDGEPVTETGTDADGGKTVTRIWEYDTWGHVKKAVAGGFCYTYEYRADGKLVKKSASGRTLVSCTYFPDGSLESLTDASGKPVYYEYDWRGKLSGVKDEKGGMLVQYAHTPGGKLKEIRHGNGLHTLYEYDTDGNIIRLRLEKADGETVSDWKYEYDLDGNRTLKMGCFMEHKDRLCDRVIHYQYDKMDRLTEESYDGEAVRYGYDLCGNRLERVDKNSKEVYNYNVRNQLLGRKSAEAETCYQYDRQGNVLQATGTEGGTQYYYNAFNQQIKVLKSDGNSLESQYDGEYLRAGTVENGKVLRFAYYKGELLAELDAEQGLRGRYVPGYGTAAGWSQGSEGYSFYHLDEQNSTAYITGQMRNVVNRYQYDAFGQVSSAEGFSNRILYTGQQYDKASGQYYLRARFYDPCVGRFLQEDVYRGDGLNLYAYCRNNPVVYYDPSGFAGEKKLPDIVWPSKPHANKTPGHWETIIDQVKEWVASGIYEKIYVNKGIKRELGPGNFKNTQPDVWGVRSGNGKIDQVEVPSKTDKDWKLRDKMKTNQAIMGEKAGSAELRDIPDEYKNNPLPGKNLNLPDELAFSDPSKINEEEEGNCDGKN